MHLLSSKEDTQFKANSIADGAFKKVSQSIRMTGATKAVAVKTRKIKPLKKQCFQLKRPKESSKLALAGLVGQLPSILD